MINVHIQQDVPTVVPEPFHTVIVSVILETTQATPPPPPTTTTITLATQVPNTEAKSSTPKESSRGKPPSKPSKSRKTRSADDNVEDTVIEIGSDDVDQIFDKKADDSEQPSPNANTEKPSLVVAPKPKRQKHDWYKKSLSLEPQDPDWNTVKMIDDAQEQPWFKEKVNAAVPPLTFDELMSTPINSLAFAMNCLGLTMLTREVLVGPVFNLLKGYDRLNMGKPLPLIEKEGRLTIPVEIFFNNDAEYLKGDQAEKTYCSSITNMPTTSDIEDMLLLIAQQKINNLDVNVILDFVAALKRFAKSIVVQNKVKDVQLGVEC
nr:hypothetical protein [Tanacetum cinerariifolium]